MNRNRNWNPNRNRNRIQTRLLLIVDFLSSLSIRTVGLTVALMVSSPMLVAAYVATKAAIEKTKGGAPAPREMDHVSEEDCRNLGSLI